MNIYDRFCIVRSRDQGVVCGVVNATAGRAVEVADARQIHGWSGDLSGRLIYTLFEMALYGAPNARISEPVEEILILDACGIIPCTPEAEENLRQSRWDADYDPSASRRSGTTRTDSPRPTRSKKTASA